MSEQPTPSLDRHIGEQVRALRARAGLSLQALAQRSGVSRSMISVIERGEASATAVVLEKVATGLGVALAALFNPTSAPADPVARRADQPVWRDPQTGYLRRNLSPVGVTTPLQIVEVLFPPGERVAYETGSRPGRIHQQVWVLEGAIQVTVGEVTHRLATGDCLDFVLDQPTAYHNPGDAPARYLVAIVQG